MALFKGKLKIFVSILLFIFLGTVVLTRYKQGQRVLGETDVKEAQVYGLIIPHHDLAEKLIMEAIDSTREDETYKNIVIIGPNHFYPDTYFITTADSLGVYKVDKDFVMSPSSSNSHVAIDNEMLEKEHSILVPLRYLTEAYPDANITPLVISTHSDDGAMDEVSQTLSDNFGEKTLFVLAIDFAHNVGLTEGLENNNESIAAISSFDYEKITNFTDKYLDSTLSTILFLKIMEKLGAKNWETLDSSHGSVILGIPDLQGTSYVTGVFTK